jgi:predicted methyltransferase
MACGGAAVFITAAPPQFEPPRGQSKAETEMLERAAREANKKRQQEIQSDTDKLFELANELKEAVGKSNEHVLSLDVIRKADEVEKLAHRVKEKMREAVGPSTQDDRQRIPAPRIP